MECPASHRNSRGRAGVRAAFQDFRNLPGGQRRRHGNQRQSEKRSPAHRVNVRKRVGCRDFSEMLRNVRNRREKVRSGENRAFRGDFPNRRIVRIAGVYQQFGGGDAGADLRQHFAQNGGCNLASASAAGGEAGQANRASHCRIIEKFPAPHKFPHAARNPFAPGK